MSATATRIGGHLVVDCLEAAGVDAVFGVPGIHALAIWDGLADSPIRYVGMRTELAAGFAADGYARAGTRPGVLLTTTGPGSFVSTCALMEARTSYVPLVNIVSQVPRAVIGTNRGFLHELPTQSRVLSSFAKWHAVAGAAEQLPGLIAEAFRQAASAPPGPVVLEIPVDVLEGETDVPAPGELDVAPVPLPAAAPALLAEAAGLLASAERPVLWAGGGVLRAGGSAAFRELAERLDAPAATTYMGKGAIPGDHPLALGSACDEGAFQEILRTADVVLAIGTELGAETTGQWTLQFEGRLIQVDARAEHLGLSYEGLGIAGDARAVLEALLTLVPDRSSDGEARVAAVHARIASGLAAQGRDAELQLLGDLRAALRRNDILVCDMTLTGYLAAPFLDVYAPDTFLYPLGSGTLGYAWPAAIGAKVARPEAQVLAVHGDGGVLYSVLELLSARQHGIAAKLLVVDDGGYGILRVYQEGAYGRRNAVDLVQPDFVQLGGALGVPVFEARPRALASALAEALAFEGPALIHLPQSVVYPGGDALMDLALTPELLEIQERSRRFCDEHLVPVELQCELEGGLPDDVLARIHDAVIEARLHAVNMPAEWGGQGYSWLAQVICQEQLGRSTNALWDVVWRPANVLRHCDDAQRASYLLPEIQGDRRYAYAVTEPGAGSDASTLETRAVRVPGGWRIDGEKWFVTAADVADYLIVVADAEGYGPTAFLVDQGTPGLRETRRPRYMHTFVYEHPEYVLEGCEVPDSRVLGGLGKGHELSREWFVEERLMIAARCLGGAQRALEVALAYACEREQFGQTIAGFQGVSFPLASSAVELAAARSLVYQVAWDASRGLDPKTLHAKASAIKLYASEMAGRVVDRALQVLGGRGYMRENPVERLYRDLRVDRIWEGTSEIQRVVVANELVKRGAASVTGWPVS